MCVIFFKRRPNPRFEAKSSDFFILLQILNNTGHFRGNTRMLWQVVSTRHVEHLPKHGWPGGGTETILTTLSSQHKGHSTHSKHHASLLNKLNRMTISPSNSTARYIPKRIEIVVQTNTCTQMFIAALFIQQSKDGNNPSVHQ